MNWAGRDRAGQMLREWKRVDNIGSDRIKQHTGDSSNPVLSVLATVHDAQ